MIGAMDEVAVFNAPPLLTIDDIRSAMAPVLSRAGATEAFVIGSFARGTADAWSDVDLVVVMPTDKPFVERPRDLLDVLDAVPLATDLFVYTPEEFARGRARDLGIFAILAREGVRIL
jgi:predicted nucleotidyltransferase